MGQASRTLRNLTGRFGLSNTNDETITEASLKRIAEMVADPDVTHDKLVSI